MVSKSKIISRIKVGAVLLKNPCSEIHPFILKEYKSTNIRVVIKEIENDVVYLFNLKTRKTIKLKIIELKDHIMQGAYSFTEEVMKISNKCPCIDCKNRCVGCHGTCELYILWRDWYDTNIVCKERNASLVKNSYFYRK